MQFLPVLVFVLSFWQCALCFTIVDADVEEAEITAYHFHTYYFQDNPESKLRALEFRREIHSEIEAGTLQGCSINHFNTAPVGPHPIGSWETCCNASSISRGLSWFMQNRGNYSVLLHPLTRYEVMDHTSRAMFLGAPLFLDLTPLSEDLGENPLCPVYPWNDGGSV